MNEMPKPKLVFGYAADFLLKFCMQFAMQTGGSLNDHQLIDAVQIAADRIGIDLNDTVVYDQFTFADLIEEKTRRFLAANGLTEADLEAARPALVATPDLERIAAARGMLKKTYEIT